MFIGIDLGTTFIKAAVLDLDNCQIAHVQRLPFPDPLAGQPPLHREFDPAMVISAVQTLLERLLPLAGDCDGVVMTSQMHGLIFTTANGAAQSNLTTWQDQRGLRPHPSGHGSFFAVMQQQLTVDEVRQLGNELRVGLPIGVLDWYVQTGQPLPSADLIPASLPDFVIANLCACPPVTELTNAAAYGLLNLDTLDWHHSVIAKLGLQKFRLPAIQPHGAVAGTFTFNGRQIPIYTPVGDYQCALAGALWQTGELSLNISTGSQVSLLTPTPVFGDFQTRVYFDRQFTKTITHLPAGRALNALVTLLSELAAGQNVALVDPWPYIISAAEAVEPTNLKTDLSFFTSSVGDQGSITGIQEANLTVGHLFRSAFDTMAENYYASALKLSPEKDWDTLVFSGGLSQKIMLLRTLIAARFDTPYRLTPHTEDTLLGLLGLAVAFTGRADSVQNATKMVRDRLAQI